MRKGPILGFLIGFISYLLVHYGIMSWMWDEKIILYIQSLFILLLLLIGGIDLLATFTAFDQYDRMYIDAIKDCTVKFTIFGLGGCLITLFADITEMGICEILKLDPIYILIIKWIGAAFLLYAFWNLIEKAELERKNAQLSVIQGDVNENESYS